VALIYHPSVIKQKSETISNSPEMSAFFDRLEVRIIAHPELGLPDTCLLANGKTVSCYKQSIEVYLFNDDVIYVFKLYFTR